MKLTCEYSVAICDRICRKIAEHMCHKCGRQFAQKCAELTHNRK